MEICSISSVCTPVKHRYGAPWMRPVPSSPCRLPLPPMAAVTPTVMTVKKRHAAFGGAVSPSMAPMWKPTCTPAPLAIAVSRPYGFIPISSIEVMTASTAYRRWSPPSPAIMASPRACGASGSIPSAPRRGRSLSDRARRPGASTAGPAHWRAPSGRPCLPERASKPYYL